MTGVVSIIVILLFWRFLILFGTAVFQAVGLSPEAAAFEARSAITGSGYTTSQSELVARNPAAGRTASILILTGYFGPATILALLGVSFVIPTSDDLSVRVVVLVGLLVALFAVDRIGLIRAIASRPSKALARRMVGATTFETWIEVGDDAVASLVLPSDPARSQATLAALTGSDVTLLAIEPAASASGSVTIDPSGAAPGDRLVLFGPQQALAPLRKLA